MDIRSILSDHGFENAKNISITVDMSSFNQRLTDLDQFVNGSFRDGIIQDAEAKKIQTYLNVLNDDYTKIVEEYNALYANTGLADGPVKDELVAAKAAYDIGYNTLIADITTAIADGVATQAESDLVDTDYLALMDESSRLQRAMEAARDAILGKRTTDVQVAAGLYTDQQVSAVTSILQDIAVDSLVTQSERGTVKDTVSKIVGYIIGDTASMPPLATLDSSQIGEVYSARQEALNAGLFTSDAAYLSVGNAYTTLANYLNALNPKPWDVTSTASITVDKTVWRNNWLAYYSGLLALKTKVAQTLKQNADSKLQASSSYNGVTMDSTNGIVVKRGDNKLKTTMNATDGIKISQSADGTNFTDVFYADTNGVLHTTGLVIDSTSLINGTSAGVVVNKVNSSLQPSTAYNGVTIDTTNGVVVTSAKNVLTLNGSKGIELKRTSDNVALFTVDSNGNLIFAGSLNGATGSFGGSLSAATGTFGGTYTGTITFDQAQGGSLKIGESLGNGNLQVWADVNGDGVLDVVGRIDWTGAYFPTIQADNIIGNVVSRYTGVSKAVYFDTVNGDDANDGTSYTLAKKNPQAYINSIPKNLNGQSITIYIRGDVTGGLTANGFIGGDLLITSDTTSGAPRYKVYGFLVFNNCVGGKFLMQGFDMIYDATANTSNRMCAAYHCSHVQFYSVKVYGANAVNHGFWFEDCHFNLGECHVYNITDRGLYANRMSHGYMYNCHGDSTIAILADEGAIITGAGSRWNGSLTRWNNSFIGAVDSSNTGWTLDVWTIDKGEATTTAPPTPTAPAKLSLATTASTGDNYSVGYGGVGPFWTSDDVKQGDYGYGNRTGIWYFDLSAIKGKTIDSATFTVHRNSGGTSAARTLKLVSARNNTRATRTPTVNTTSNVTSLSIAVGQTATVDVTALVQNNIASGIDTTIGCYTTTGSTDYMDLGVNPNLNITYH